MRKSRGAKVWGAATLVWLILLTGAPAQPARRPVFPGGPVVIQAPLQTERGSYPRVVVQTVPGAQVTATVLAIRYRYPAQLLADEVPGRRATAAHLLEHLMHRSRPGQVAGSLLVRSEALGGESLAYLTSSTLVLGETVPAEQGLESLELQIDRLRAVPSDPSDLKLEKQAVAAEIGRVMSGEESARREILRLFGVDARVEGDADTLAGLGRADLEALMSELFLGSDVVVAVVGPMTAEEVRRHLAHKLAPLHEFRQDAPKTGEIPAPPGPTALQVESLSGYRQHSFFFSVPEMSASEMVVAQEVLSAALGGSTRAALTREDHGLYRLDVSPPLSAPEVMGRLEALQGEPTGLSERAWKRWLDLYEAPLKRAEMLALETLALGAVHPPPGPESLPALRERVTGALRKGMAGATTLELQPADGVPGSDGLYPFVETANAPEPTHRETLSNGLSVVWQEMRDWPLVAISGFFRLRRTLTPAECEALEKKLEARGSAGLDYDVRPEALFFHLWCPAEGLTESLSTAAAEIRALAESAEVLVEQGSGSSRGALESFFLAGLPEAAPTPIRGSTLLYPDSGELVLVGDIDPRALELGLRPAWNGWFRDRPARGFSAAPSPSPSTELSRTLVLGPQASPLLLIGVWGPNRSTQDFLPFNLALQTLAGRPVSNLLARQLRDSEGLVETVSVFPMTGSERGDQRQLWLLALRPRVAIADASDLAARVESRLAGLGREPLPEAELERTRRYLKSALRLSTATARGRARVLANSEFYRLSELYSTDYAGLYDRIDGAQVQAVMKKYLAEQKPRWLYLRPSTESEG